MAVIKYFVPGLSKDRLVDDDGKVSAALLRELGLAESLRDITNIPRDATLTGVQHGPGGADGILMTPTQIAPKSEPNYCYEAASQLWIESLDGNYWLGTESNEPIMPADLQRRKMYLGYNVEADDGMSWMIPIARSEDTSRVTLPQDIYFVEGLATKSLRKQYRHLLDIADKVLDWTSGEESDASDETWRIDHALVAMNVNYRLWRDEINLSREAGRSILSSPLVEPICLSLADIQFAVEFKKKDSSENGLRVRDLDDSSNGTGDGFSITPVGVN